MALSGKIIVVVEDDPDIARLLELLLQREGYVVARVPDGRMALGLIEGGAAPSLAILDVMLPYHDGFELLQAIRRNPVWSTVPVLMLTSKSQEKDIVHALDSGANDYVVKPFQPGELLARLRRLLREER